MNRVPRRATSEPLPDKEASRKGRRLFYGIRCPKNFRKAFPYLLQAAKAGYVHSQNLVGFSYAEGLARGKEGAETSPVLVPCCRGWQAPRGSFQPSLGF